jgi:hypothetical protein
MGSTRNNPASHSRPALAATTRRGADRTIGTPLDPDMLLAQRNLLTHRKLGGPAIDADRFAAPRDVCRFANTPRRSAGLPRSLSRQRLLPLPHAVRDPRASRARFHGGEASTPPRRRLPTLHEPPHVFYVSLVGGHREDGATAIDAFAVIAAIHTLPPIATPTSSCCRATWLRRSSSWSSESRCRSYRTSGLPALRLRRRPRPQGVMHTTSVPPARPLIFAVLLFWKRRTGAVAPAR